MVSVFVATDLEALDSKCKIPTLLSTRGAVLVISDNSKKGELPSMSFLREISLSVAGLCLASDRYLSPESPCSCHLRSHNVMARCLMINSPRIWSGRNPIVPHVSGRITVSSVGTKLERHELHSWLHVQIFLMI